MAINRELSQFGRLVQIIDNVSIGIGTTSNVSIGFGTISATTFSGSNILVGTATSTGTASQRLQVTGGAYVSGSVGIGSAIPTAALDIVGDARVSGVVTATSFSGDGSLLTNLPSGGGGTSSQWTTGATGITTTSNVGIGTTNASYKLHVVGSGSTTLIIDNGSAKIVGNLNVTGTVYATDFDMVPGGGGYQSLPGIVTSIIAGSGITISPTNGTGAVTIYSTNTSQWTSSVSGISTTSNVGINSSIPTSALDVLGNAKISGVTTASSFVKSGGTSSQFLKADGSVDSSTYLTSYTETDTLNSVTGRGNSTSNGISVGVLTATSIVKSGGTSSQFLKADGSVDSSTYLTTTGSGVNLTGIVTSIVAGNNITISGSTGQVTVNSTGGNPSQWTSSASGITTTSNVGIKSTTPSSALDVLGNAKISGVTTASSFVKSGGTSSQFLKADGSVDSSTYLTSYSETDTLNSVTSRGNSTSNGISVGVLTATRGNFTGIITSTGANISGVTTATSFSGSGSGITGLTNSNLSGSAGITNANLANSTISGVSLGSNLNTLTLNTSGTGLSGSTTFNGSGASTFTVTSNATSANTASTIVARNSSGNFSAGTITASLSGNATGLSGTPNITVGTVSATTGSFTGTITNSSGRPILNQSGSILQVVSTTKTDTFSTTSDSMTNVTGLSASITPSSTSSKILVCYSVHMGQSAQYYLSAADITRSGSQIAIGDADGSRGRFTFGTQDGGNIHGSTYCYSGQYLDSPSSTSSLTYQIRIRSEGGNTVWVNRGNEADGNSGITQRLISMITLMEVSG